MSRVSRVGEMANADLIADALTGINPNAPAEVATSVEDVTSSTATAVATAAAVAVHDDDPSWLGLLLVAGAGLLGFVCTHYLLSWVFGSSVKAITSAELTATVPMPAQGIEFAKWAASQNEVTELARSVLTNVASSS